jgi:hypothetical protein
LYRENAKYCAKRVEQSRDLLVKAAYQEMVCAWIMLAQYGMIGRVEETLASFEARSAPRLYPTAGGAR